MVDIADYNKNPSDLSTLIELARQCQASGLHEMALLLVEEADRCTQNKEISADDKLKLLEIVSICGYYSKIPARKFAGETACETISLDRSFTWHSRNLARLNSTFYTESAATLMPSTWNMQVEFTPPDDYRALNPSIATHDNEIWMIQRTVNYEITPSGTYDMRGDTAIRTRNHLLRLANDLTVISSEEILPPIDLPEPKYNMVIGWEDCRLFFWKDELWCTSTVRELSTEGWCEIVMSKIIDNGDGTRRFADYQVITPKFCDKQQEKNWMPAVNGDDLWFLYSNDPVRIINSSGELLSTNESHIASDNFRGGGQLIPFNNGWLAIIHESHYMFDHRRRYLHRFVWYNSSGCLVRYSKAFYLSKLGIEFAAGIARHPTTNRILVSYGVDDKTSWLASFDPNEIKDNLIAI